MAKIILTTLNARYIHASLGLRYLRANLGDLRDQSVIREATIKQHSIDLLETLVDPDTRIVGVGVYIWNAQQSLALVRAIKRVYPHIMVVVGGPEVSYEQDEQAICQEADYIIGGPGENAFVTLCRRLLADDVPPKGLFDVPPLPTAQLCMPYDEYTEEDVAHRVIYVEASRGCPFRCEFCLSALDKTVEPFDLDTFLGAMERLWGRGVRRFKFVDRTFNLQISTAQRILQFFYERLDENTFVHFEMIPDRLPVGLREWITKFPPGSLQFEVGIQSSHTEVCKRISRKQDWHKVQDNFRFLTQETGVHIHADVIVGLPGETWDMLAQSFDAVAALRPHEIQVGILKRLRGAPIVRHDQEYDMVYSAEPPYEVLRNNCLDFATMQRLKRFARYWGHIANSGHFPALTEYMLRLGSPFETFMQISDRLHQKLGRSHAIALDALAAAVGESLVATGSPQDKVNELLAADYATAGRKLPTFLKTRRPQSLRSASTGLPVRQTRHLKKRETHAR